MGMGWRKCDATLLRLRLRLRLRNVTAYYNVGK
jgi:hypothetical protein